jgi:hypothetical protein
MKNLKKLVSVFLCAALCVSAFAICAQAKSAKKYVKSISVVKKATITIPDKKSTTAKSYAVTVKVSGKASKAFTAKSSKTSVATVKVSGSKIKVTAKKEGTAKITVTTKAKSSKRKKLSATLTLTVKKATACRLVKGVKVYQFDYDTKKWELEHRKTFEYKNAYPTVIDEIYDYEDGDEHNKTFFEYTFENGVPVKCICTKDGSDDTTTMEYSKGRLYEVHYKSEYNTTDTYYQYANGNDYFTSLLKETHSTANSDIEETMEEADAVNVTLKNGIISKSVNSGYYANWDTNTPKQWLRFNGTYTCTYDSDGIAKVMSGEFRAGPSGIQERIVVKKNNGVITEAVVQSPDESGKFSDSEKVVFEYKNTAISPARFSNMMNYCITGAGTNYYNNNWF